MTEKVPDQFSRVSREYRVFRPSYPSSLFTWLASVSPARRLAWDCGTGTGQATRALVEHFDRVVPTDASRGQLAESIVGGRVLRCCCTAESAAVAPTSVDLVTVAQAIHWFDRGRFFREALRVLVPGGILAVWTYGSVTTDCEPITDLLREFEFETVGRWWPPGRVLVNTGYRDLELPGVQMEVPTFRMSVEWTLEQVLGSLGTWSAVLRHRAATGGGSVDPSPPETGRVVGSIGRCATRRVVASDRSGQSGRPGPGSRNLRSVIHVMLQSLTSR